MPIYEFLCGNSRCPHHEERFEERLSIADRDAACVRCPKCNSESRRCVVPSAAPVAYIMEGREVYGGNKPVKSTRGLTR